MREKIKKGWEPHTELPKNIELLDDTCIRPHHRIVTAEERQQE